MTESWWAGYEAGMASSEEGNPYGFFLRSLDYVTWEAGHRVGRYALANILETMIHAQD